MADRAAAPVRLAAATARRAADGHGTPCYVQDMNHVRAQYERLRSALPGFVEIFYAVKANPHPPVVEALAGFGAGLEVASLGELTLAIRSGTEPARIAFAGPAKTDAELKAALQRGVLLNMESAGEHRRADAIARHLGVVRKASVRVSPPWGGQEDVSIIGGTKPSKFGVDLDLLDTFLESARSHEHVRLAGLHVFNATNVLEADALGETYDRTFELAVRLGTSPGIALEVVDLGGGLGVPYRAGDTRLDVGRLGERVAAAARRRFGTTPPRVIVEPGRYLVAEAGTYLTRVIDRKSCRGVEFVLCDGGINHLLRPALIGQAHPMWVVGREDDPPDGIYDVAGPLCTSLDVLGSGVALPDPQPGDLIAVGCAGAYGYTESMLDFLSHPRPAQVVI